MLRSQHRVYDGSGEVARTQDVWGAEGISGRVKFLPLAWAGMPKTSFSKNSDSPPGKGLVFHTDRGSQYTSQRFRKLLTRYGLRASMGDVGSCYDNAVVERFFGSLCLHE